MKKSIKKSLAIICSGLILMPTMATAVNASEDQTITKEEKIYGILNTDGSTSSLVVSNYIHSSEALDEVKDSSSLENIVNLKNGDVPVQEGDDLTWQVNGHELYYQGTTDKELPVTTNITYTLDGKDIDSESLEGVTGDLEIRISQENNISEVLEVNGEERELFVPFYTVATLGLKTSTFSNVDINKGKIVNDGNYFIVVGGLMPGMKENIGDNDYIELEDEIVVTMEVTDYEKPPIYLLMSTEIPEDQDLEIFDSLSELDEKMIEFDDAANELEQGGKDFYNAESQYVDGLNSAFNGVYDLNSGIKSLASNMSPLKDGFSTLIAGVSNYATGATEFAGAVTEISIGVSQLVDGLEQLAGGLNNLNSQTSTLSAGLHQEDESLAMLYQGFSAFGSQMDQSSPAYAQYSELLAGLELAANGSTQLALAFDEYGAGVVALNEGAATMISSSAKLIAVPEVLNEKVSLLNEGALALSTGGNELNAGMTQLSAGVNQLQTGSQTLTDGVVVLDSKSGDLLSGARSLRDGITKFNEEGVKAITSEIREKEESFEELVGIYEALELVSDHYTNFSGGNDQMNQSVEFVLKVSE